MRVRGGIPGAGDGSPATWRVQLAVALSVAAVVVVCLGAAGALGASAQTDENPAAFPAGTTQHVAIPSPIPPLRAAKVPMSQTGAPLSTTPSTLASTTPSQTASQEVVPKQTPAGYDTAGSPCPKEAAACVDVTAKKAWLQSDGVVTRGPVSMEPGQPGHMTPLGTFHVSWKAEYTVSTLYGIPMPYAVFWADGGIAFHEGPLDTPSHGCVHLAEADAKAFFDALDKGDEVFVW